MNDEKSSIEKFETKLEEQSEQIRHNANMQDARFDRLEAMLLDVKSLGLISKSHMILMTEQLNELSKDLKSSS